MVAVDVPVAHLQDRKISQRQVLAGDGAGEGDQIVRYAVEIIVLRAGRVAGIPQTVAVAVELPERARNDRRVGDVGAVVHVVGHAVGVCVIIDG